MGIASVIDDLSDINIINLKSERRHLYAKRNKTGFYKNGA
jgi:hypothetical protein